MSIQYAGGTILNTTFSTGASTPATDIYTAIVANLATAGWTRQTDIAAFATLTFAGQPADGDTVTLDSAPGAKTYRFKTVIAQINDVLIDSTLALTISNLSVAITAGAGAGTKYFTGTTAHTTFNVKSSTATTLVVQYITAGAAGNGAPLSKVSANITLSAGILGGGQASFLSAITPQGLQALLVLYTTAGGFYTPGTAMNIIIADRTQTRQSINLCQGSGASNPPINTQYRILANKYQFCLTTTGARTANVPGSFIFAGVPYIPSFQAAQVVATASGTPISCNVTGHGMSTGQQALIVGGLVNTNMNGLQTVTVVDANNFTLNGTSSNGTYTANSAYTANVTLMDRISEALFGCGTSGSGNSNWGNDIRATQDWTSVNTFNRTADGSAAELQIVAPFSQTPSTGNSLQWTNNNFVMTEPLLAWGVSNGAVGKLIGQMWDAVLIRKDITLEQAATFDTPSHNFLTMGVDATRLSSLMIATS